jgi:OmpA-OmpF porin, OOP family
LSSSELKSYQFNIIGHSDKRGDETYNLTLSQSRADKFKKMLMTLSADLGPRLNSIGQGETHLLSSGDEVEDHYINRRVEIETICH